MTGQKHLSMGEVIAGKYRVDGVVGSGGMGVVLAATHVELGHRLAIKVMQKDSSPSRIERFRREARVVARLESEHVARVTDFGELADGAPYVVMEYLDGRDLADELRARGPLPIEEAVGHVLSACEALAEAHAHGIVHRDIKPKNLFLARRASGIPVLKVLDFGLAKDETMTLEDASITRTQDIFGSPAYMAPEQMRSAKDADARSDIWALGITLYELIAGEVPFHAPSVPELCVLVLKEEAAPLHGKRPEVSQVLSRIVQRCLEKEPKDRFDDIQDLARRLEPFGSARHEGISSRINAIAASTPTPVPSVTPTPTSVRVSPTAVTRAPELTMPEASANSVDLSAEILKTQESPTSRPQKTRRVPVGPIVLAAAAALAVAGACIARRPSAPVASTNDAMRGPAVATSVSLSPPGAAVSGTPVAGAIDAAATVPATAMSEAARMPATAMSEAPPTSASSAPAAPAKQPRAPERRRRSDRN